ncbi:hypothetical protein [uncultured Winogradskyella sp.]|uniref:hypothetical protein n=1 Tax=uncultured Winogradskyella sp. TaxID=395353 RepID=UPI0026150AE4|nr:hypothetical protein [uncultured Winogradskyella sp.]
MAKFCVFCGKKPENKTKEHIIPKWLIKLTGDEKREISLGLNFYDLASGDLYDIKNRLLSFQNFQFPACDNCNQKYSNFEANTSVVIKKILKEDYINESEINQLLDWFDKVRIGLWLGSITLDKIKDEVSPKFYINNRIGTKDRALYIYKLEENHNGINFHGFNTPAFQFVPSIFGLRINNFFFINYSIDNLLAERFGLPFYRHLDYEKNTNREIFEPMIGSNKIQTPILQTVFPKPTLTLFQSILSINKLPEKFINEYVKNTMASEERSKILYYDSLTKRLSFLEAGFELRIDGKIISHSIHKFNGIVSLKVIEELENVIKFNHHKKISDKKKIAAIEKNRTFVLQFHKSVKKIMEELIKKDNS